jgi:hypothetical protein
MGLQVCFDIRYSNYKVVGEGYTAEVMLPERKFSYWLRIQLRIIPVSRNCRFQLTH